MTASLPYSLPRSKPLLITNAVLLLLSACSFAYNLGSDWLPFGLVGGLVLMIPSLLGAFASERMPLKTVLMLNTWAVVSLVCVIYLVLYLVLTSGNYALALNQIITLLCALGLTANSQLLAFHNPTNDTNSTVNDLLQRAFGGPAIGPLLALALITSGMLLTFIAAIGENNSALNLLQTKLLQRGMIPFLTIGMFFWGLYLLVGNYILVKSETTILARTLGASATAKDKDTQAIIYQAFAQLCHETKAQKRDQKLGQLQLFMEGVWSKVNYFFTLPRYINWAIPIMGFLGTVLGISLASESIATIISSNDAGFGGALGEAFTPLGIAFDTTLISLTLSVVLMLIQSLLQRWQERKLHELEQTLRLHI